MNYIQWNEAAVETVSKVCVQETGPRRAATRKTGCAVVHGTFLIFKETTCVYKYASVLLWLKDRGGSVLTKLPTSAACPQGLGGEPPSLPPEHLCAT